jgi:hypothetical protein
VNNLIEQNYAVFFPLCFASMWLVVTTILAVLSGWFRLMAKFPDQSIAPLLRLRRRSGTMGLGVGMRGILTLSVCPSGLRVGMMRIFGPFCRDFLVPWEDISVTRKTMFRWPFARLQFGNPVIGTLSIPAHLADQLARAALGRWPEAGPFPEATRTDTSRRLLLFWVIVACVAALFFMLVPLAFAPSGERLPTLLAIAVVAIVLGIVAIVQLL